MNFQWSKTPPEIRLAELIFGGLLAHINSDSAIIADLEFPHNTWMRSKIWRAIANSKLKSGTVVLYSHRLWWRSDKTEDIIEVLGLTQIGEWRRRSSLLHACNGITRSAFSTVSRNMPPAWLIFCTHLLQPVSHKLTSLCGSERLITFPPTFWTKRPSDDNRRTVTGLPSRRFLYS